MKTSFETRPNIALIFADDLEVSVLDCNGSASPPPIPAFN